MAQQGLAAKAAEDLAAATVETLIQLVAATNHGITILGWGVSFAGTSVTEEPIRVRLLRQTTAGTSSSLTLVKADNSNGDTLDTTGLQDFTAEPTASDVLEVKYIHPQGWYEKYYPFGREIKVGAGDRIGIDILTATGVTPNVSGFIHFEE